MSAATGMQRRPAGLALSPVAVPDSVADELEQVPDVARRLLQAMALYADDRRLTYHPDMAARWLGVGRPLLLRVENLLRDCGLIVIEVRTRGVRGVLLPWLASGSARPQ